LLGNFPRKPIEVGLVLPTSLHLTEIVRIPNGLFQIIFRNYSLSATCEDYMTSVGLGTFKMKRPRPPFPCGIIIFQNVRS